MRKTLISIFVLSLIGLNQASFLDTLFEVENNYSTELFDGEDDFSESLGKYIPCETTSYCKTLSPNYCCAQITQKDGNGVPQPRERTCAREREVQMMQNNPPGGMGIRCLIN